MSSANRHASDAATPRRDRLLWVVAVIAAFALYDIWGSWTEVGNKSGFAHGTGWTLTVIVEVYGGCALYAWLAGAPGPRSRKFAMRSAVLVFALSLIGQSSSHLTAASRVPPAAVVVFVSVLPVIVLALIAFLIHLRHLDREDAAKALSEAAEESARLAAEAAEADDRAALRIELDALRESLAPIETERDDARRETAEALRRIDVLTRKLAAAAPRRRTPQKPAAAPRSKPAGTPAEDPAGTPAAEMPGDVDVQTEALAILVAEPDISGAKLGARVGRSERWGQDFKKNLAESSAGPESRSGERS